MYPDLRHDLAGEVAEVAVVGEVDYLADPRHFAEEPQHFFRSRLVKGFHYVVVNVGYGREALC